MENTGEQFIPDISSKRLREEHCSRYEFAKQFCIGKSILDIACGTGYGTYEISKIARSAIGVDYSENAIAYAENHYRADNLKYIRDDCSKAVFNKKSFDVIVSFETIEHLEEEKRKDFYKLCCKHLKDDGIIIISTPNKKVTSPYTKKPLNKHHVLEFDRKTLQKDLSNFLIIKEWLGQRYIFVPLLWKAVRKFIRLLEIVMRRNFRIYSTKSSAHISKRQTRLLQPRIFLVIVSKKF